MSKYKVEMLVDGLPVVKIPHRGQTYLPVEYDKEFSIQITNYSDERILAVVSVDGLSVMDGKPAGHNSGGYIINGWSNAYEIKGWRRGNANVARFKTTTPGQSYAGLTRDTKNVGVIGVAIYPEKGVTRPVKSPSPWKKPWRGPYDNEPVWPNYCETEEKTSAMNFSNSGNARSFGSVGTGYGREVQDHVRTVSFNEDASRKEVIILRYETPEALQAMGISLDKYNGPNPFPLEQSDCYCPPPVGWRD